VRRTRRDAGRCREAGSIRLARATLWDATGGEDDVTGEETFWAVFLVDDAGPRLLTEYSILTDDMTEPEREALLKRTQDELPDRLLAGEFDREIITPVSVPEYLFDVENLKEFDV
jgi:hypothetical protein